MAKYYLYARKLSDTEIVFDDSLKTFYNKLNNIQSYSFTTNSLYLNTSIASAYHQNIIFKTVQYRNRNNQIVTICTNMNHQNSYGAQLNDGLSTGQKSYSQTEIPNQNQYGIYDVDEPYNVAGVVNMGNLIMNKMSRTNPYLYIEITSDNNDTIFLQSDTKKSFYYFTVDYKDLTINSTTITRDHANTRYTIDVKPNYFDKFDVEIWKVNTLEGNKHSITVSSTGGAVQIPYKYFQEGQNIINAIAYNGNKSTSKETTINHLTPNISSLKTENERDLIDDVTNISWVSTNQAKAEIFINDSLYATLNSSVQLYVLPKGKLKVGKNKIKVRVYNAPDDNVTNSSIYKEAETSITLSRILPAITNDSFTLNDTNIDNKITFSWQSTNQTRFGLYQDDIILVSGNTAQSCTIKEGILKSGNSNFKLIVYYESGFDTVSVEATLTKTLTCNIPIIYNLEPSNLNKNINEQIAVTFSTNDFCDRWELKSGSNIASGTTERSVIFGSNTFTKGDNTLQLTIFYTPKWDTSNSVVRTATKTVTFFGYGVPSNPKLVLDETYSTSAPCLFWEQNEEQTAYEYTISKNDEIIACDEAISTDNYVFVSGLEDKTTYEFSLRIKNKWGLYSGYVVSSFSTLFNEILLPNFYLTQTQNGVTIAINGYQEETFKSVSVYRRTAYEPWVEIAHNCNIIDTITDSTTPCGTDVLYKLRVYNTDGAYKDTESKSINIMLRNYLLLNVENLDETFQLDFVKVSTTLNTDFVIKKFTNRARPTIFKGKANYATLSLEVEIERDKIMELLAFINESNEYNLFCFKSYKGERKFVMARIDSYAPVNAHIMSVSMELTEIDFIETRMHSGTGYRKIVYVDGKYALNGAIDLSGNDDSFITNV